jgi:hypothetical protein
LKEHERQKDKISAKLEKTNYFPFTHGDLIEYNRKMLGQLNLMELQRSIREKESKKLKRNALLSLPVDLGKIPGLFPQKS